MGSGSPFISLTLAAMAGVFFVSGLALISSEGVKQDGENRDYHVNAR